MIRPITKEAIELIKHFEGFFENPYLDQAKIPTIGIGTIAYPSGKRVTMQDSPITLFQAEEYLRHELTEKADTVCRYLIKNSIILGDQQYSALVSFAYNCGCGAIIDPGKSLNEAVKSKDVKKMADAMLLYCKYTETVLGVKVKKVSKGLLRRRKAEAYLLLNGKNNFFEN